MNKGIHKEKKKSLFHVSFSQEVSMLFFALHLQCGSQMPKEQTRWDFMTSADCILASIFTSDIISYDSSPKSKWTLFSFPQMFLALQPRAAISFLNFLPCFIQGNLSGLRFYREIKLYVLPLPNFCPILRSVFSAFFEGDYYLWSPASSPFCLIRYGRSFSFRFLLSRWQNVYPTTLTYYRYRTLQWLGNNHCTDGSVVFFPLPWIKLLKFRELLCLPNYWLSSIHHNVWPIVGSSQNISVEYFINKWAYRKSFFRQLLRSASPIVRVLLPSPLFPFQIPYTIYWCLNVWTYGLPAYQNVWWIQINTVLLRTLIIRVLGNLLH